MIYIITKNEQKQINEKEVLHKALDACMTAKSRNILCEFLGDESEWNNNWKSYDRPDIYKVFNDKIVGIEHFAVDKFTDIKKKEYQWIGKKTINECEKCKMQFGETALDDAGLPVGELIPIVGDAIIKQSIIGDKNLFQSLIKSLKKHANSTDEYKSHLKEINGSTNENHIKIGCLIEISGRFDDMVLFEDSNVCINDSGIMPISYSLLEYLSWALQHGFDFIVLYRTNNDILSGVSGSGQTIVMNCPMDFSGVKKIRGEKIYSYIPASSVRNFKKKVKYYSNIKSPTNIIQNVQLYGNGVDLRLYWSLVFHAIHLYYDNIFFTCDLEFAATIYAITMSHAKWRKCQYLDAKQNTYIDGIQPYGFNEQLFQQYRIYFLLNYRTSSILPRTLLCELYKAGNNTKDFDDEWKQIGYSRKK